MKGARGARADMKAQGCWDVGVRAGVRTARVGARDVRADARV